MSINTVSDIRIEAYKTNKKLSLFQIRRTMTPVFFESNEGYTLLQHTFWDRQMGDVLNREPQTR